MSVFDFTPLPVSQTMSVHPSDALGHVLQQDILHPETGAVLMHAGDQFHDQADIDSLIAEGVDDIVVDIKRRVRRVYARPMNTLHSFVGSNDEVPEAIYRRMLELVQDQSACPENRLDDILRLQVIRTEARNATQRYAKKMAGLLRNARSI